MKRGDFMKFKYLLIILTVLIYFSALQLMAGEKNKPEKHPNVDLSIGCQECHAQQTPNIFKEWKESKHGVMNYGCYMCHGDGVEEFAAKPKSERCTACHSGQTVDFTKLQVKNCFTCHQGHSLKFHQ